MARGVAGDGRVAIRAVLTGVMGWLAVVLLLPGETFRTSVSFRMMAEMANEWQWAMAFAMTAGVGIVGIATRNRGMRVACGLGVATMHGVVALCLVIGNPLSTGSGTYGLLACLGYYLVWEHAREGV